MVSETGAVDSEQFRQDYKHWVEEVYINRSTKRSAMWSESIAVGSEEFVEGIKIKLGGKAKGRNTERSDGVFTLSESQIPYSTVFDPQKDMLSSSNTHVRQTYEDITVG